ncbi:MAG: SMP-30/gluconolactonase/LRE family protein [Arachnia sp.]
MSRLPARFTVFRHSNAILGESLVAAENNGEQFMLWCDITRGLLHRSPVKGPSDGSADTVIAMPAPLSSFHPAKLDKEEGFVMSLKDRVVLTRSDGTVVCDLAHISHKKPDTRMNEGKPDPHGRWVSGSMDLEEEPTASYYSVSADGTLQVLVKGLGVANGLEFSDDGRIIYYTDTPAKTIYRGNYSEDGEVTHAAPFIHDGPHDGLTLDVDGGFWTALYGEGRVIHYDAAGIRQFHIDLPAPNLTSVAFGGAELSTLYVCSARENLTDAQLQRHPLSGSIFSISTHTQGRAPRVFGR